MLNKPLSESESESESEPMMTQLNDAYMHHSATMS